jgi:hypothetical protein
MYACTCNGAQADARQVLLIHARIDGACLPLSGGRLPGEASRLPLALAAAGATIFLHGSLPEGLFMRIACLAWGSLLWKPGALKLATPWTAGGPALPLEFARDSDDSDELAIVLYEDAPLMPTYYAVLDTGDLTAARAMLAQREKIDADQPQWIGSIPAVHGAQSDARIAAWLEKQDVDAVVWTALPPKFNGVEGRAPTAEQALAHLAALPPDVREHAEDYIRRVPAAIRTPYRGRFEEELGWTPREELAR